MSFSNSTFKHNGDALLKNLKKIVVVTGCHGYRVVTLTTLAIRAGF
jgi:hypothetical protein